MTNRDKRMEENTTNTHEDSQNELINEQVLEQLAGEVESNDEVLEELSAEELTDELEQALEQKLSELSKLEETLEIEEPSEDEILETASELSEEEIMFPNDEDLEYPEEAFRLELDHMDESEQEDKLWKARTGLNEETICGAIETIIFMSDKPVPLLKLKSVIDEDMPLRVIHEAIARLQKEYEESHHGIRLQEVAQGYQFRTKATYSKFVQDLFKVNELVLSPTALEVLAIIAYKQPVSKVEIEKIRGVDSSHIVRGLMDKRLVRVAGRSEEVGKPVLYGTTPEFLEVFNLANVDQLPPEHELEEIATQGVGKIEDIRTLVNADIQSRFNQDEMDELDKLSLEIKSIDSETQFTKSLRVEERKRTKGEGEVVKTAFDLLEEHLDMRLVKSANKASCESEVFTAITSPSVIEDLTAGPFNVPEEEEEDDFEMIDLDTGEVIKEDEFDMFVDIELEDVEGIEVGLELSPTLEDESEEIEEERSSDETDENFDHLTTLAALEAESSDEDLSFADEADELEAETAEDAMAVVAQQLVNSMDNFDAPSESVQEEKVEEIQIGGDSDDEAKKLAAALDDAFSKLLGGDSLLDDSPMDAGDFVDNIDATTDRMVDEAKDLDLDLSFMKNNDLDSDDNLLN